MVVCEMGMDKSFRDILFGQEREDDMSTRSEEDMTAAVRGEFSNAESLIAQAHERGFSLSASRISFAARCGTFVLF